MKLTLQKQKGFTLVELVIVLVIIGLLATGVFKASELITNVKVKRLHKELVSFKIATYGYLDKTGTYPGGSGGSRIVYDLATDETDGSFFKDLQNEGFIISSTPNSELGGYYFATFLADNGATGLTLGAIKGTNQVCVAELSKTDAISIDSTFDDNEWNSGNFRTVNSFDSSDTHTLCIEL